LNELALFAGAGGGILGGKLLGWRTVCAVECDEYARRVLMARQNDGCLEPFPIWDDVRTFDGRPWAGLVDVVSGGFPCQDISVAGTGKGLDGERSGLWSEMARIVREVGPRFVFVENSPALTARGLGRVLGDLASLGYDARWGVLGAVHAGAPHKRERIWIVADNSQHGRRERRSGRLDSGGSGQREQSFPNVADSGCGRCGEPEQGEVEQPRGAEIVCSGEAVSNASRVQPGWPHQRTERERAGARGESCGGRNVSDSDGAGCEEQRRAVADGSEHEAAECGRWWEPEPDVGRVAHGVASRVDRLRAIGNGQVPAVVALAWNTLKP